MDKYGQIWIKYDKEYGAKLFGMSMLLKLVL